MYKLLVILLIAALTTAVQLHAQTQQHSLAQTKAKGCATNYYYHKNCGRRPE